MAISKIETTIRNKEMEDEKMYLYRTEDGVILALTEVEHSTVSNFAALAGQQNHNEFIGCYVKEDELAGDNQ